MDLSNIRKTISHVDLLHTFHHGSISRSPVTKAHCTVPPYVAPTSIQKKTNPSLTDSTQKTPPIAKLFARIVETYPPPPPSIANPRGQLGRLRRRRRPRPQRHRSIWGGRTFSKLHLHTLHRQVAPAPADADAVAHCVCARKAQCVSAPSRDRTERCVRVCVVNVTNRQRQRVAQSS